MSTQQAVQDQFEAALQRVVQDLENDSHVLAAVLCGSLAYDTVWEKSDIDLVVISTDDQRSKSNHITLLEDDINIHTLIQPRSEFKRTLDASFRNDFQHSMFARSRLLFSKDPTIKELLDQLSNLGEKDLQLQAMCFAQDMLAVFYKAKKWNAIKDDIAYTAHWLILTARSLGDLVVTLANELTDRESLLRAQFLEPKLFQKVYTDLIDQRVTKSMLNEAVEAIDEYLARHAERLFGPILDYLRAAGSEPRTATEISEYFRRNYNIRHLILACEWLSDSGMIQKVSMPTKLTLYSRDSVEELAFFHT